MDTVFSFCEELSRRLTGREIRQILLVHANTLTPDPPEWVTRAYEALPH